MNDGATTSDGIIVRIRESTSGRCRPVGECLGGRLLSAGKGALVLNLVQSAVEKGVSGTKMGDGPIASHQNQVNTSEQTYATKQEDRNQKHMHIV